MAKCIAIAAGAADKSHKKVPQEAEDGNWDDKWKHGYVGCVLRQRRCGKRVTRAIAEAKELIDKWDPLGKGWTPSKWDIEATMYGWKKGLWKARWKWTWRGPRLKKKSCVDICNHYRNMWIALKKLEDAAR